MRSWIEVQGFLIAWVRKPSSSVRKIHHLRSPTIVIKPLKRPRSFQLGPPHSLGISLLKGFSMLYKFEELQNATAFFSEAMKDCWRDPQLGFSPYEVHSHAGFLKHLTLRIRRNVVSGQAEVMVNFLYLRAPHIVYVSCNPFSSARDLDYLCHGVSEKDIKDVTS